MHALPLPGDLVWLRQRRWRVVRAVRRRDVARLDLAGGPETLTLLVPFDRPVAIGGRERPRRVRRQRAAAQLAGLLSRARGARSLDAAVHADVALLPYQLEPALAVVEGARRVLIADEVGLGKTIQAGLVIAELARREPCTRVLIAAPAALIDQWRLELDRRFAIPASLAGRDELARAARDAVRGESPWQRAGTWIASFDYLKQPHVLDGLPPLAWDLVVIDEAHGVCGDSDRHAAAVRLAARTRRLLLLTATPHDGDAARFARLLALGDDPAGRAPRALTVFRRTRADVGLPIRRRVRWCVVTPSSDEARVLDALVQFERGVVRAAGDARRDAALLLLAVFRKRAVSTMAALAESLERRRHWVEHGEDPRTPAWRQPSLFDAPDDDIDGGVAADLGLDPRWERAWLKRLAALASAARRRDSKLARLHRLLRRAREPVAVFTEFRHSLEAIVSGLPCSRARAVLHGGQAAAERAGELRRFLDGAASILVSTDVASQGVNLQHRARWIVNLELPWNPARLEQRLGRVDRLGQTRPVHMTLLVARHPAEATVLARLARRTLTARRGLGADVLGFVPPDPALVREEVLTGASADAPVEPPPVLELCRHWTRAARTAARTLDARRRLAARWRGPDDGRGRARRAIVRAPLAGAGAGLLVFAVPIVDGLGAPLEDHVIAVRVPRSAVRGRADAAVVDAARAEAAARLRPRAARLRRWLVTARARDLATDRALGDTTGPADDAEAQPGLFDRRAALAFVETRRARHAWLAEIDRRVHDPAAIDVVIGRPALAFILVHP